MKKRIRNSPTIESLIREYMLNKGDEVSLNEINDYVQSKATILSKTPRNTVFSVIFRMSDVQRISRSLYKYIPK